MQICHMSVKTVTGPICAGTVVLYQRNSYFFNTKHAKLAVKSAIKLYNNNKRLHLSLGYKTPNMVFESVA